MLSVQRVGPGGWICGEEEGGKIASFHSCQWLPWEFMDTEFTDSLPKLFPRIIRESLSPGPFSEV